MERIWNFCYKKIELFTIRVCKLSLDERTSGGVNHTQEAVAALMVLGYTQAEALHAMKGIDAAGLEADEIIRQCLKKLVKQ